MQYLIWIVAVLAVLVGGFFWANRPEYVSIDVALPDDFAVEHFSHESFETLLARYVSSNGRVDYNSWHDNAADVASLNSYLAAVARYSPKNDSSRFPSRNDELVYWIHGYNAWVIKSVLGQWPLTSVTDIKAPIEAVKGLGFFYKRRFPFGGEYMSLLSVENNEIRKNYKDARIHFVLNCGAESCPVLRPALSTGENLETELAEAASEFVADPRNVTIDHSEQVIRLSTIFKWYEKDFMNDLSVGGKSTQGGLGAYVASVAPQALADELRIAENYRIEFIDYDWSINASDHLD